MKSWFTSFILSNSLVIILIVCFVIRIIPAFIFYGTGDVNSDSLIAIKFLHGRDLYRQTNYNHFPVLIFLWAFAEILQQWTGIGKHFWQKLPSVISDVVLCYLIYKSLVRIKKNNIDAIKGAFLYALNPVVILTTSFHGQYDSLLMLVVVIILYLFQFYPWEKMSKPILLLSLFGITLKGWLILTPAVIAFHAKKGVTFMVKCFLLLLLITLPFLLIYQNAFIKNVFAYYPAPDHGIGAVFEHFPSFFRHQPLALIKFIFFWRHALVSKVLSIFFIILAFIRGKRMNIFNAMLLVYLVLYSFSTGLGSQYLMWVVPLAIIVEDTFIIPYSLCASFEIIAFYLDRYKSAFTATVFQHTFVVGSLPISYGKMILIFWLLCVIWMIKKFNEIA